MYKIIKWESQNNASLKI